MSKKLELGARWYEEDEDSSELFSWPIPMYDGKYVLPDGTVVMEKDEEE